MATEPFRLLHEHDADDRGREDVEARERDEVVAVARGMVSLSAAIWARIIVNSPWATSAAPTFRLWRGVKPPTMPAP